MGGTAVFVSGASDEIVNDEDEPEVRDSYAKGKVLSVIRYDDRYSVDVSVGADDGIQSGIGTHVYIIRGAADPESRELLRDVIARGQVVDVRNDRANCHIGPSHRGKKNEVPRTGDTVVVRKKHFPATFVLAKNVVVHDGRILDWGSVRGRLAELNTQKLIAPSLRFTQAMRGERDERLKEFDRWCLETTGRTSSSFGSLGSSVSKYYDSIPESQRALRDAARRRVGVVVAKGKRVAHAEVIVNTQEPEWVHEIYLEHGQLRDPYSEPSRTLTELNGKFDVFPESDRFQLMVLHSSGFALVNSDSWPDKPEIELKPWAQITGKFDSPVEFDETVQFESRQRNPGWAELRLEVWNTPLRADRSFQNQRIPPGDVVVTRAIKSPRGGATGILHDRLQLAPGESRRILIGPLTENGRQTARDYLRREGVLDN